MLSSCSFKSNTDFPKVTHIAFQKENMEMGYGWS